MAIKYWEFEDAPFKEKVKSPAIKEIAKIFFDNDTEAYRFSLLLLEIKKKGRIKLKDAPKDVPIATAKRYLDFAVQLGLLKHEDNFYELTDRFSKPFRNIAAYIKEWMESKQEEDLLVEFANANFQKQTKRGGRRPKINTGNEERNELESGSAEPK